MTSPHPRRRSARPSRVAITFAAIAGLALLTPAMVSAQPGRTLPSAAQQAPGGNDPSGSQPPVRTDTTLNAGPMPVDAAPVSVDARSRVLGQHEISAKAWEQRPPANRATVKPPKVKWTQTEMPKAEVIPGQMRSDREEIPEGFTKADADKAETMEAAVAARESQTGMRAMAAPGCQVYWPAPYEVCGAIRDKYNALGGPSSFLLFPMTNEITNPDGLGKRTEFQNGPIYWSAQGGAHPVVNHFLAAWARHGYENSYIGYPTSDEIANPDGIGRRQHFTGSTIYWRLNEAYSVGGAIADRWHQLGAERADGLLGYPISDEHILPDGVGRMNRFERGVIYWHPSTGAHEVVGPILETWSSEGYEMGPHGYPVAGQESLDGGASVIQAFQQGSIEAPGPLAVALAAEVDGMSAEEALMDARAYATAENSTAATVLNEAISMVALKGVGALTPEEEYSDDPVGETPMQLPAQTGDYFVSQSVAPGIRYDWGHAGIFISGFETVDATGWKDDDGGGPQIVDNSSTGNRPAMSKPRQYRVNANATIKQRARQFALSITGPGVNNPTLPYNFNAPFNRKYEYGGGKYNCSQVVWAAYMWASDNDIDLDKDQGAGVWPADLEGTVWSYRYAPA